MATAHDDRAGESAAATAGRLEHEIDEIRADLEEKVGELAERRPAVLDESGPLRRHGRAFAAAAAVVLAGTALAVFWRWRRPKALVSRVARTMRRKGARLTLLGGDRS